MRDEYIIESQLFSRKALIADDGSIVYISRVKPPEVDLMKDLLDMTESEVTKNSVEGKKT